MKAAEARANSELLTAMNRTLLIEPCIELSKTILPVFQQRGYKWLESQANLDVAMCFVRQNQWASARSSLEAGEQIARENLYENLQFRAESLAMIPDTFLGNLGAAWAASHAGLKRFWNGHYPAMRAARLYSELNHIAENDGMMLASLQFSLESMAESERTKFDYSTIGARIRLATLAGSLGQQDVAADQLRRSRDYLERQKDSEIRRRYLFSANLASGKIMLEQGRLPQADTFLKLAESDTKSQDTADLQLQVAATRAEWLLKQGNKAQALASYKTAATLSREIVAKSPATLRNDPLGSVEQSYRGLLMLQVESNPVQALETWDEYRALPMQYTSIQNPTGAPVKATVVSYALLGRRVGIWVNAGGKISFQWSPLAAETINALGGQLHELSQDNESSMSLISSVSKQLHAGLVAPVLSKLNIGETVIVDADSKIVPLPFAVLEDGQGLPAMVRNPILQSPGNWYQKNRCSVDPEPVGQNVLIVAGPKLQPEKLRYYPPINGIQVEVDAIVKQSKNATVLTGAGATPSAILPLLNKTSLFHFAGHSVASGGNATLLLAEGNDGSGELTAKQISLANPVRCRLAVLSACSTALRGREAATNLVQALLNAGVRSVVASGWNVNSQATGQFMEKFYGNLFDGRSVAQAIQSAQTDIRSIPGKQHPYYWAPFAAYGCN